MPENPRRDPTVASLTRVIADAARLLRHERHEEARELLEAVAEFLARRGGPEHQNEAA